MDQKYILEGKEIKPVDLLTWAAWFETADRHIAKTPVGKYDVSTVFSGLNHNFGGGNPPLLFETTVFRHDDGSREHYCNRYSTYTEAEEGHAATVAKLEAGTLEMY